MPICNVHKALTLFWSFILRVFFDYTDLPNWFNLFNNILNFKFFSIAVIYLHTSISLVETLYISVKLYFQFLRHSTSSKVLYTPCVYIYFFFLSNLGQIFLEMCIAVRCVQHRHTEDD